MKKNIILLVSGFFLLLHHSSYSQVGINTNDPDSSAVLDLWSRERGLLIPRMNWGQRRLLIDQFLTPAHSLLLFDTNHKLFYFLDATETSTANPKGTWKAVNPWTMNGAYANTNSNSVYCMNNVGIGTNNPVEQLEVNGTALTNILRTAAVRARNNNGLQLFDNDNRGIFVEDGGRVGINVYDPDDHLDVDGSIDVTGSYKLDNEIILTMEGNGNLLLGPNAGLTKGNGWGNLLIGVSAGRFLENGDQNICLGGNTGYSLSGDKNICIGYSAGSYGDSDNIIISNSPGSGLSSGSRNIVIGNELSIMGSDNFAIGHRYPLISGDFERDYVYIEGRLIVRDSLVVDDKVWVEGDMRVLGELTVDAGCVGCASDSILKKSIQPIPSALDKINKLEGYTYLWKENTSQYKHQTGLQIGFMAQEVQKEFPLVVDTAATGYLYVDYQKMVVPLVIAVKELNEKIDSKDKKIKELEDRLARIEKALLNIESNSANVKK